MARRGSFHNQMYANMVNQPDPTVGMGVTEVLWTDRTPYQVVEVVDEKTIIIQRLNVTDVWPTGYGTITEELGAERQTLTKRSTGRWCTRGAVADDRWLIGKAMHHHDVNF